MQGQRNDWGLALRGLALVVGVGAWTAGILLGSLSPLPPLLPLGGAAFMALLAALFWRARQGRLLTLLTLCLCLGMWRYCVTAPENDPQSIQFFIRSAPVRVRGTVVEMPQPYGRSRSLIVETSS